MSIFLIKSEKSLTAAKLLNEKDLANSSIHCSYYCCVQMMLHILIKIMGETESSLYRIGKDRDLGSHETMINVMAQHLRTKDTFRNFNNDINQLKLVRKQADYKEVEIMEIDKSREVYRLAKTVRDNLNTSFAI